MNKELLNKIAHVNALGDFERWYTDVLSTAEDDLIQEEIENLLEEIKEEFRVIIINREKVKYESI